MSLCFLGVLLFRTLLLTFNVHVVRFLTSEGNSRSQISPKLHWHLGMLAASRAKHGPCTWELCLSPIPLLQVINADYESCQPLSGQHKLIKFHFPDHNTVKSTPTIGNYRWLERIEWWRLSPNGNPQKITAS